MDEAERVDLRGDAGEVAGAQEALGEVGADAHRGFAVAVEDLLGHGGEVLAGGVVQVVRQPLDRAGLAAEQEGALQQAAAGQALELGGEAVRAVELAVAVLLDLLVGLVAVFVGDLAAAEDLGGELVDLGRAAADQEDLVLGRGVAGLVQQAAAGGVVVLGVGEFDDGLDGVAVAGERGE